MKGASQRDQGQEGKALISSNSNQTVSTSLKRRAFAKLRKAGNSADKAALAELFYPLWMLMIFSLNAGILERGDEFWNPCPIFCEVPSAVTIFFPRGLGVIINLAIICKIVNIWNYITLIRATFLARTKEQALDLTWPWRAFHKLSSSLFPLMVVYCAGFLIMFHDPPSILFIFHQIFFIFLVFMIDYFCQIESDRAVDHFVDECDNFVGVAVVGKGENAV